MNAFRVAGWMGWAALLAFASNARPVGGLQTGDEFVLLREGPGQGLQGTPAVAFGKTLYLAAWREGWHGKGGSARIHAARITPTGDVLDPMGIAVGLSPTGVQERPRVAWGSGVFLIVWQDFRNGKDYDTVAARVTEDGTLLDPEPIMVAGGPRNQVLPDAASDGESFLVVWQGLVGEETGYRGFAAAVAADGTVSSPVETGMTPQPRVAWNGAHFLAAGGGTGSWQGNVQTVRLAADGRPQGKPGLAIRGTKPAAFSLSPVPAQGWLVVCHRSQPDPWGWGGPGAMRAVLMNADGLPVNEDGVKEPAGVQERLPGWLDFGKAKRPGAAWPWGASASAFDGRHSVVVWQRHHLCGEKFTDFENCDLIAARVDGYRSLDPSGIPVAATASDETEPALASSTDGRLLLVYEKRRSATNVQVVGRMLRSDE